MTRLLIVGDPHSHADYSNDRFEWLGRYIVRTRPDEIVVMGDWSDVTSLNKHGKLLDSEGRRLQDDKRALHDSLRRLEAPITSYNRQMAIAHRSRYRPRKYYVLGNHENRLNLYEADNPALKGVLTEEWWEPFLDAGWDVIPFLDTLTVEGYQFSHFFPSGTMGRPIGGKTGTAVANSLLLSRHVSSVVGHDHRFGMVSTLNNATGGRHWGINAGCFVHPDANEGWCRQTEPMWDRGVLLLDGCKNGDHTSHTWTTQAELQRRYGAGE